MPWLTLQVVRKRDNLKNNNSFFYLLAASLVFFATIAFATNANVKPKDMDMACTPQSFSENVTDEKIAIFEGREVPVAALPKLAEARNTKQQVLGENSGERWIDVDLSEQKLRAYEGDSLFLETLVSSGLPWSPTPTGEFRIWTKFRATKMEGGAGKYYYYLPNVPYVMFFSNDQVSKYTGYSLHGTYWHNDFGKVHSHGCVNLPTPIAETLYYWVGPVLQDGKKSISTTADNPGTKIVIHE